MRGCCSSYPNKLNSKITNSEEFVNSFFKYIIIVSFGKFKKIRRHLSVEIMEIVR